MEAEKLLDTKDIMVKKTIMPLGMVFACLHEKVITQFEEHKCAV